METEKSRELVVYFERADGKTYSINIPDYLVSITKEQIAAATGGIVTEAAIAPDGIALTKPINAVKVDTTKVEIPLDTE